MKAGGHLRAVSPFADQTEICPAAKRKAQRIKQNGLAGPGFTGQHSQAGVEGQGQAFDQDNV